MCTALVISNWLVRLSQLYRYSNSKCMVHSHPYKRGVLRRCKVLGSAKWPPFFKSFSHQRTHLGSVSNQYQWFPESAWLIQLGHFFLSSRHTRTYFLLSESHSTQPANIQCRKQVPTCTLYSLKVKVTKVTGSDRKWPIVTTVSDYKWLKWPEVTGNLQIIRLFEAFIKLQELTWSNWKWSKVTESDQKWPKVTESDQKWQEVWSLTT